MRRVPLLFFAVLVLFAVLAVSSVRAEDLDVAEPAAVLDDTATPPNEEGEAEGTRDFEESDIVNPNYEEDVKRLKKLCITIRDEMKQMMLVKNHFKHESKIMALAADLGHHLDAKHHEWETTHHDQWTCKQARDVLDHEAAKQFVDHFEDWYEGKDLQPPVSHAETVRIVTHLRDELHALGLMNQDTLDELNDIINDLNQLEKWHLALRKWWDELNTDKDADNCEKPFQEFVKILNELHTEHVPEWFHVAEGVNMLWDQCKEDPNLNADL